MTKKAKKKTVKKTARQMKKALKDKTLSKKEASLLNKLQKEAKEKVSGGTFDFWNPEKEGDSIAGKIIKRLDNIEKKKYKKKGKSNLYSILVILTSKGEKAVSCQGYALSKMVREENPKEGQLIAIVFKGKTKSKNGTFSRFDYAIQ